MPDNPHFKLPLQFGANGHLMIVEQDSVDDMEQRVELLLRTERGQRLEIPEYGIENPILLENGPNLRSLHTSIDTWAPEAGATLSIDQPDFLDKTIYRINASAAGDTT